MADTKQIEMPKPADGCENCRELQRWAWSVEDGVIGPHNTDLEAEVERLRERSRGLLGLTADEQNVLWVLLRMQEKPATPEVRSALESIEAKLQALSTASCRPSRGGA